MSSWHSSETDALVDVLVALRSKEDVYAFLEDICTIKEVLEIAQRWRVAKLLEDGVGYQKITELTGVSTATISRVRKCLDYGSGGYRIALDLEKERKAQNG